MIRAANSRKLKKIVEEFFYKSNNSLFSSNMGEPERCSKDNKDIKTDKSNDYKSLKEKCEEEYNDSTA
jgi:hypothetical protein